jgi:glycosyltransferase involved in cell wall biosynthesis
MLARPPVALLSSFPPRECGIATFARDLIGAIESTSSLRQLARIPSTHPWVIAMNEPGQTYEHGSRVRWAIDRDDRQSYLQVAGDLRRSRIQLISIQHEYGLFGGEYGDYLLDFMDHVRQPIVLTMHTVLERPNPTLRRVTERLINRAGAVVVLAESAHEILDRYYRNASLDRVIHIPHGTPVVRREPSARYQHALGLDGRTVLSTFGLLGPDKGIEDAICALPAIVSCHPEVVYLVLGQTHPGQRRHAGESYREMLHGLVDELGLRDHVRFYDRYLSLAELLGFLQATDLYVMPYLNPRQIVSGTLAYAVACGKVVVATPFVYAREMLADKRGVLVDFRSPESIGRAVNALLDNPDLKEMVEGHAYTHGRRMHWPAVGKRYLRLFQRVIDEHDTQVRETSSAVRRARSRIASPMAGLHLGAAPGLGTLADPGDSILPAPLI